MNSTYHLLASTHPGLHPLTDRDFCSHLWSQLQQRIPEVWACVFMPDHIHLLLEAKNGHRARWELAIELRAATRRHFPGKRLWARLPEPDRVPDLLHLKRTIRYIHLNPCRSRLTQDPIEWEWSTHRDTSELTAQSWIHTEKLARLMNCKTSNLSARLHAYVSSDPSVSVSGTHYLTEARAHNQWVATPQLRAFH